MCIETLWQNVTHINLHFAVKSIIEEEVVCHTDSMWFHRMTLTIIVVSHITWDKNKKYIKNILDIVLNMMFSLSKNLQPNDRDIAVHEEL